MLAELELDGRRRGGGAVLDRQHQPLAVLKGNKWLKTALRQGVPAALRCKKRNYFQAQYHRIKGRRDGRKATTAVAASIITAVHAMLRQAKPYRDLGNLYYLKRDKEKLVARLQRQARELGYELQPQQAA